MKGQTNTLLCYETNPKVDKEMKEIEAVQELDTETQGKLTDKDFIQEQLIFKMEQYKTDI